MRPEDADGVANSIDPDRTAPTGAVRSGSVLFIHAYCPKNWNNNALINLSQQFEVFWLNYIFREMQLGQRSNMCLSNNSITTEANSTKLHRKIEHNK